MLTSTLHAIAALATASYAAPSIVDVNKSVAGVAQGGAAENAQAADYANAAKYAKGADHAQAAHAGAAQVAAHNKEYNHANGAYDKAQGTAQEWNNAKKFGGNVAHGNTYGAGAEAAEHEAKNTGHGAAYGAKLGGYTGYGVSYVAKPVFVKPVKPVVGYGGA